MQELTQPVLTEYGKKHVRFWRNLTEFGSLNHRPGKRVLNYLKTIYLRLLKVIVERDFPVLCFDTVGWVTGRAPGL